MEIGYNIGNGVDEATKIHYFKSNILPSTDLENSLTSVRTKLQSDFASYIAFLTTEVEVKQTMKRQITKYAKDHSMSSAQATRNKKHKRYRGQDDGSVSARMVDDRKVEGKCYSKEELSKLTKAQHRAVINLSREKRRRKQNISSQRASDGTSTINTNNITDAIVSGVKRGQIEQPDT